MTNYTSRFIAFAKERIQKQGDEIRRWEKSDNPLLSQTCKEIIEAAGEAQA